MTPEPATTLSDFTLERYCLNELPDEVMQSITTTARQDPALRRRIEALESGARHLREAGLLRDLEFRVTDATSRPRRTVPLIPVMAVVAGLVALVVWMPMALDSDNVASSLGVESVGDRVKGESVSLSVYRRVSEGSEQLSDGAPAREGDLIRVAYRASTPTYGVIVSIDGAGVVTIHLPADGSTAVALTPGEMTLLDSAYELDDAPRWERFFLVTGDTTFAVEPILEAAQRAVQGAGAEPPGALSLPSGLEQTSFLLRKVQ